MRPRRRVQWLSTAQAEALANLEIDGQLAGEEHDARGR